MSVLKSKSRQPVWEPTIEASEAGPATFEAGPTSTHFYFRRVGGPGGKGRRKSLLVGERKYKGFILVPHRGAQGGRRVREGRVV
jgi:hypothetical protein